MPAFCYCFCGKACKCFDKSSTRSLSLSQQLHPLIAHSCLLSELLCSLVLTTACSLNCLTCSTVLLALSIALCSTASLPLPLSLPSSSLLLSKQTRGTAWAAAAAAAADNFALFRPFWGVARRQVATHAHSRRVSRQRRWLRLRRRRRPRLVPNQRLKRAKQQIKIGKCELCLFVWCACVCACVSVSVCVCSRVCALIWIWITVAAKNFYLWF